ncbi:MAG: hypothetical protein NC253_07310 [Ruminococcus sp.]|nr:hypothetical protein [Ruminococcus sp.]MCM1380556.1 hypothetical protein [Muribaculaceae bacterium]MCM1478935.1 hypothetical protein [Muribaculaceae bacterium]
MGIYTAFTSEFFSGGLLAVLLLVYLGFAVADLFKRHLLSNTVIYWITMLLAPFAAVTAIVTPISDFLNRLDDEEAHWGQIILTFIGGAALLVLTAVVYVRGHISPLPKDTEQYGENRKIVAASRLIKVGLVGTVIYLIPFVIMTYEVILFVIAGTAALVGVTAAVGIRGLLSLILVILIAFFVPIANIIVIFIFSFVGIEFALWGVTAIAVLLADILTANGCIRYILTTDKSKGQKAWRIFLALVPAVNVVYGIICLVKINKALKSNY